MEEKFFFALLGIDKRKESEEETSLVSENAYFCFGEFSFIIACLKNLNQHP